MNIGFIGYGNMAKAIVKGLLKSRQFQIFVSSPSLKEALSPEGIFTHYDNLHIASRVQVLILAVKPAQMKTVWQQIYSSIPRETLVISIAAGLSLSWFGTHSLAMIRAMPNLAAAVEHSATALFANAQVNNAQSKLADQIFSLIGLTYWTSDEDKIDACTAFSSSGLAYVFQFMDAMIQGAVQLGVDENHAKNLVFETINGALEVAKNNALSLPELSQKVTSPGGTTAAALAVLKKNHFENIIIQAIQAAYERAQELKQ